MSDLNSCAFTGRLTKDAEVKLVGAKQTPCCEFSIANNTGFGQYAKVSYINVHLWGQSGQNLLQYLTKGQPVAVCGEFAQNDWVDTNGVKHTMWRLSASKITLLGGGKARQPASEDVCSGPEYPDDMTF